jgi:hypothetical protein
MITAVKLLLEAGGIAASLADMRESRLVTFEDATAIFKAYPNHKIMNLFEVFLIII